jgi:hypothetical protein
MYGFYPKFKNDEMEQESEFNKSELNGAVEMNFNFKYSGFLGQIVPFTIDGKNYWTTCGKNSTNYKFSNIARDLVRPEMTKEFLDILCTEKLHICGETLSKDDQKHGASVSKEGLVVTLIAKGHWIELIDKVQINGSAENFIEPYNQVEMHKFCLENNLLVDAIFKITTYPVLSKYMESLSKVRNIMQTQNFIRHFIEFIEIYNNECQIIDGNIRHDDYLGEILEGLIIKLTIDTDGKMSSKTIKYKFPFYTSRTMFLRQFFDEKEEENIHNPNSAKTKIRTTEKKSKKCKRSNGCHGTL